jgi:23S rRNA pseudouridine1911/1915/1917 synthase
LFSATSDGLISESHLEVLERRLDSTLCAVKIFTGRPHQIRIHTATIGHPLVGDPLYDVGGIAKLDPPKSPSVRGTLNGGLNQEDIAVPGDCGYHLHAHRLSFLHPRSQQPMNFTAIPSNPLLHYLASSS